MRTLVGVVLFTVSIGHVAAEARTVRSGWTFFETSRLTKPKKVGVLHSAVEIPADVDQSRPLEYACIFAAYNAAQDGQLAGVKAAYRSEAYVVDHLTGAFEVHRLESGTMKTAQFGFVRTTIGIPAGVQTEIFTDGLAAGDATVFLVTRADPRKGKKLVQVHLGCELLEE